MLRALVICAVVLRFVARCNGAVCEEICQAEQRQALLKLFNATGGDQWNIPESWGGPDPGFSNDTLPDHCSWYKVVCCTLDGQYGTPAAGPGPLLPPSLETLSCTTPGGVLSLVLPLTNLRGPLPADVFPSLGTLTSLDLSGTLSSATALLMQEIDEHSSFCPIEIGLPSHRVNCSRLLHICCLAYEYSKVSGKPLCCKIAVSY